MASSLSPADAFFTCNQIFLWITDWFNSWFKSTVLILSRVLWTFYSSFLRWLRRISHRICLSEWDLVVIGNRFVGYLILQSHLWARKIFHILKLQTSLVLKSILEFRYILLRFLCLEQWASWTVALLKCRRFAIWLRELIAWSCLVFA